MAPPKVTAYLCGATVQALPHIGHLRSAVSFDVLIRWLMWHGYDVVLCRNITDIDDKILRCADAEGVPYWQLAQRNERAFTADYQALGCLPPAIEPRATGHIPEMISLISRLIDTGHAYASEGDVYFSVRSWPHYGALSNQRPSQMLPAEDGTRLAKRDPLDFALWKGAKPGEPWWESPWGRGRPGWHLECSAMAEKYLGTAFDIHGGGRDLIFPHHENEVAQSQAAGDHFARYWVHNGLVTLGGEKMSKSGSSLQVGELLQQMRPVELRYYLASAHYRSNMDYSSAALNDAMAAYQRAEGFVVRAIDAVGEVAPDVHLPDEFVAAMDDDLNTPQAIAVLHNVVRDGNTALAAGESAVVATVLGQTRAMLAVLGIDPLSETWREKGAADMRHIVDALVAVALAQREEARTRRDYAAADSIRDQLSSAGVVIEDTPQGPRWTLKGDS